MKNHPSPIFLMADDDEDDRLFAKEALQGSGLTIDFHAVRDGLELLAYLLRSGRFAELQNTPLPAVILLDLNMPLMDGRQALKIIKETPALRRIPIVIFTTSREERDQIYCRGQGAAAFITKPSSHDEWVQIMRTLAERCATGREKGEPWGPGLFSFLRP